MKYAKSLFILVVVFSFAFFSSCDSDGPGGGSDAISLGPDLSLTGTVVQTFDTSTNTLSDSYTNTFSDDYYLKDESSDLVYYTDDNEGEDVEVDIHYITDATLQGSLYDPAGGGITSSDPEAMVTTAYIGLPPGGGEEIVFGDFSNLPEEAEWYYYLYSSATTTIDGSFVDGDETHVFDNVTVFSGWNELIQSTSDGETFTYRGGEISGGAWTWMVDLQA